jgi:hypothetical protein
MLKHKSVVYVRKAEDIHVPDEGVWAPGHGYPAHTENYVSYEAYLDKAEFEESVAAETKDRYPGNTFRVVHVTPLKIETTVTVSVK